jgi:hypothetical protein
MAHIRKTIREHVVTTVTSLSTTGSNVYETRYFPLQTGNLPALIVYTLDESIEDYTLGRNTRTQQRSLNLDTKLVATEIEFDTASQKTGLMRLTYLINYNTVENAVQAGV